MQRVISQIRSLDDKIISFIEVNGITLLRITIGLIYVLFGFLKFLPNYSPAEALAGETIELITFGVFSGKVALFSLAIIECLIGLGLMLQIQTKWVVRIALWHMLCTFIPMILLPNASFTQNPYSLSLVGQYILKNLIIVSALLLIYTNEKKRTTSF